MDSFDNRDYYGSAWSPYRSSHLGKIKLSSRQMGEGKQGFSNTFFSRFQQLSLACVRGDIDGYNQEWLEGA
jgi:hypothetical protein